MHVHVNDKWLCQNTAMLSQTPRETNFLTHQIWRGHSIKNSKAQCFCLPEIDLILISTYHKAVLWHCWYAIFVYSVWQLTFSRSGAKSSSLPPGGICDSGRNALTDISSRFIVWWCSIWKLLIIRRCLAFVPEGRVLVPARPWRVTVAFRGSVAHRQNLFVPDSRNKAHAYLAFRVPWWRPSVLHDAVCVD